MNFTLEPAAPYASQLNYLIMKATFDIANEWFFYDGAHNGANALELNMSNTWLYENIVALSDDNEIFAYFEGQWLRPMDIIIGFRTIHFGKKYTFMAVKAFYNYLDYLFVNRGCQAFNWMVALQNISAIKQYERFVRDYCGHKVGTRHYAQKSYTGKISDINLYELTAVEFFEWKERYFGKRR